MKTDDTSVSHLLDRLEHHLREENPLLLDAVRTFRRLDDVAWRAGLLPPHASLARQVPWWPIVVVLGTFSAGKSTFINRYLGQTLQTTGNQAVDDRFTAICFNSGDATPRTLPGLALDADPRFPFYQVSRDIEAAVAGEGRRIDAYLQLKTSSSPRLRGKIIVDSPGFDADQQRTSVLRISDHIVGLADLVLVFFDARHPEPGAMRDTLDLLVAKSVLRPDSSKFLYILNQIDNIAREDNLEEVFGAWQRSLAGSGLTAGRFYQIYDEDCAVPHPDEDVRARFRAKRGEDLAEIEHRIEQVEVERVYRVIGMLEKFARGIRDEAVPALQRARRNWRRRVLWTDAAIAGIVLAAVIALGAWVGFDALLYWSWTFGLLSGGAAVVAIVVALFVHFRVRRIAARFVRRRLAAGDDETGPRTTPSIIPREWLVRAFDRNTAPWRSMWWPWPAGWNARAELEIDEVLEEAGTHVERLNDRFADPSGKREPGR